MLLSPSGFVCICPPKSVELGGDGGLHRADHQPELHAELEFVASGDTASHYAYRAGGGVRVINPTSSMTLAETETCIAVFKGSLANKGALAMALDGCKPGMKDAEVLIRMYERHGIDMLGRLDGAFAFLLYDARQARVLAARDPSGEIPLVQARTAGGSLLIACGTYMPEGVHDVEEIRPGEFKYGWHAVPRHYLVGSPKQIDSRRASLDHGIRRRSLDVARAAATTPSPRPTDTAPAQAYQPRRRHSHGTDDHYSHDSNGASNNGVSPGSTGVSPGSHGVSPSGKGLNAKAAPYQHRHLTEQLLHRASAAAPRRASEDGAVTGSRGYDARGRAQHYQQQHQYLKRETVLAPVAEEQWRKERRAKTHQQHAQQQQGVMQQRSMQKRPPQLEVQQHQQDVSMQQPKQQEVVQQQQQQQEAKQDAVQQQQEVQQPKQELLRQSSTDGSYSTLDDDHSADGSAAAGEQGNAPHRRRRHRRKPRSCRNGSAGDGDSSEAAETAEAAAAGPVVLPKGEAALQAPAVVAARSHHSFGPRRNGSCSDLIVLGSSPVLVTAMQGLAC